jgi:hypothetical protein
MVTFYGVGSEKKKFVKSASRARMSGGYVDPAWGATLDEWKHGSKKSIVVRKKIVGFDNECGLCWIVVTRFWITRGPSFEWAEHL